IAPFLAEVLRRVREEGWLEPVLREVLVRFREWASTPENRAVIRRHLQEAADAYCGRSVWKNLTYSVASWSGGIDLEEASALLREIKADDSQILGWVQQRLQEWVDRLAHDPEARERVNAWCRQKVIGLIEKHHSFIGAMVEERLNRFSDESLTAMIEEKVGED